MEILRYTAFSDSPTGGNPAGVVLDASGADAEQMSAVAAKVGYSETAFLVPNGTELDVRYFSPLAEIAFCGHATIAAAVAFAERNGTGTLLFRTPAGPVPVETSVVDGRILAKLTSVEPRTAPLAGEDLTALLSALRWPAADLDGALPPRVAFAGNWHPIIAAGTRARLADLDYDFDALADLMARNDWSTVDLVYRESAAVFHARNPFPPGGVVEDPATGAAAAALGGYLRELGEPPTRVTVYQGADLGRPGVLTVEIPRTGGIGVSGTAVAI